MSVEANPYAPPRAHVRDASPVVADAEAIRAKHVGHEALVRVIGVLYWISSAFLLALAAAVVSSRVIAASGAPAVNDLLAVAIFGGFGIAAFAIGNGLRKFRPWARFTTIGLSIMGLFDFPTGTPFSGAILYLLFAAKGKRLFQPDYRGIIDATPHVKYQLSARVRFIIAVLFLLVLLLVMTTIQNCPGQLQQAGHRSRAWGQANPHPATVRDTGARKQRAGLPRGE